MTFSQPSVVGVLLVIFPEQCDKKYLLLALGVIVFVFGRCVRLKSAIL